MDCAALELATLLKELGGKKGKDFCPQRLEEAYQRAVEAYGAGVHWTGMSLIEHVLGVLKTLLPFEPDEDAVVGCLLHHVFEQRQWTLKRLEEEFGSSVRSIVRGVHLLSHVTMEDRRMSSSKLRSMLLKVSDDMRVVLMILCDRCFVLGHLEKLSPEEQRRMCADVLHLFAPVAARLGIYATKHILESRAFPIAYPTDAERIASHLGKCRESYGDFLPRAAEQLTKFLREYGVSAVVQGREKQLFSIFVKMRRKSVARIEDIHDLFALRTVVGREEECYQVLGLLHRGGHPVPNRFKDYIAFPKPNGYRGLHTTLTRLPGVPEGVFLEVQVRTEEMNREAEYGIAAHWQYKEGGSAERAVERMRFQRMLLDQQSLEEEGEASLVDHIFVLTPKGDIVELPEGATPLDFAFQVHTQVGLSFQAAKVNGAIVPIDAPLENGDVVEVLRHTHPRPSLQWLALLKTASARSRLRRYFVGQGVLEVDTLFTGMSGHIARGTPHRRVRAKSPSVLIVEGDTRMPLAYARCCKPEEEKGRSVVGVVTREGVLKVHRSSCKMLRHVNRERRVKVRWSE